jgi:hypothetical protein
MRLRKSAQPKSSKASLKMPDSVIRRIEFHRQALALLPDPKDKRPGVAFVVPGGSPRSGPPSFSRFCSCTTAGRKSCQHQKQIEKIHSSLLKESGQIAIWEAFADSIWHRLASILIDGSKETLESVSLNVHSTNGRKILTVVGPHGRNMLTYVSQRGDFTRFAERCEKLPDKSNLPHRGGILHKLKLLTVTETERTLNLSGLQSRRQTLEASFWYRLCYHGFREFGADCELRPSVNETTGDFMVSCEAGADGRRPVFHLVIPRTQVRQLIVSFRELLPNQNNMAIHPIPLKTIFKISQNTALDLDVHPAVQLIQEKGEKQFFECGDLERFRYGNLVYIKALGIMAELEKAGAARTFRAPQRMTFKKYQVPNFLADLGDDLESGTYVVDEGVRGLRIFDGYDAIEISPEAIDRDWCWLSVSYGIGNISISLAEILAAKREGQRFIATDEGWVDCNAAAFDRLDSIVDVVKEKRYEKKSGRLRLSRLEVLKLAADQSSPIRIGGDGDRKAILDRLIQVTPSSQMPAIEGLTSTLRPYQTTGTQWLWYLYENGFGGLLCDDMGLGKTHQVMAFMLCLKQAVHDGGPFLVVCPTTVLSHWEIKLEQHAPGLAVGVYYGLDRNLDSLVDASDVVITSYGILRRDIAALGKIPFTLVVLDEIQYIKNADTKTHGAAQDLDAHIKLGLTGTPIENTIVELKALMDVVVPGHLGSDTGFEKRYVTAIEVEEREMRRAELRSLVAPFTLRRLKSSVLDELPEKIEDIRICRLSEDQVKLYRDAITRKGSSLIALLADGDEPVPYIHIFALLTLLKQICNHPAMVAEEPADYDDYESGKWELFKELLRESIESGQKVVVYSQFVRMIAIIKEYLTSQGIGHAVLTGQSRQRGKLIARFNSDPDCRVFVSSLKAGGAGIDLVAGSVVIHYDRWWNAAKEDQATDRVHRIGQKRGVQVFKLVTKGTLEEKISAIIEKKRKLMESIVKEDDPGLLKTFSREEMVQMLSLGLA